MRLLESEVVLVAYGAINAAALVLPALLLDDPGALFLTSPVFELAAIYFFASYIFFTYQIATSGGTVVSRGVLIGGVWVLGPLFQPVAAVFISRARMRGYADTHLES